MFKITNVDTHFTLKLSENIVTEHRLKIRKWLEDCSYVDFYSIKIKILENKITFVLTSIEIEKFKNLFTTFLDSYKEYYDNRI